MTARKRFDELLRRGSEELFADNPARMSSGALIPTPNVIDEGDLDRFFAAVDDGLVTLHRGARFNTLDRPKPGGRWSLLSRSASGGWYNAEYLPQIAAYSQVILDLGYSPGRVLFELPASALQLDLAILNDQARVVVLGEAKRENSMLDRLRAACISRFADAPPGQETKKRGDEARQLAWRLWTVEPIYTWLIGPGRCDAYRTRTNPLRLERHPQLPDARELGLDHEPPTALNPPTLA
jgi:hypothetical protein